MTTTFLIACIAKSSAILALSWICSAVLRRASASLRHQVWTSAILAVLVLPVLLLTIPAWRVPVITRSVIAPAAEIAENPYPVQEGFYPAAAVPEQPTAPRAARPPEFKFTWMGIVLTLWAAGAALMLTRLIWGLMQLRKLRRSSTLVEQLPARVCLLESASPDSMPLTWGWRKPCVLLPAGFAEWERQRLDLVLAHEMAHVKRGDWPIQIAAEFARVLYWFHPLVWLAAARLREESDRAADDAVLLAGFDGPTYARHLLDVARQQQHPFGAPVAALAMAQLPMERRLTALLNQRLRRSALSFRVTVMSALVTITALIPFAALVLAQETRVIVAQNAPPSAPKAVPAQQTAPPQASATSSRYDIRGTVIEPGINHPVVGAEVTMHTETREIGKPIQRTAIETVLTDAQGAFRFRPGKPGLYVVNTAPKEGYIPGNGKNFDSFQAYVTLTEEAPTSDLVFFQTRAAQITGTLVDDETGKPLSGVRILASPAPSARGGSAAFGNLGGGGVTADENGRFTIPNLAAARHFLQVPPTLAYESRVISTFTDADAAATDIDYDGYDFIRGVDLGGALPIPLSSGGTASAGTVRARKITYYRARVTVEGADCSAGEAVSVAEYTMSGGSQRLFGPFSVPCGKDFLARMLRPGESFLEVSQGKGTSRRRATARLIVTDRNLELRMFLAPGVDVSGSIAIADGADRAALDKAMTSLTVGLRPVGGIPYIEDLSPIRPDASGRFLAANRKLGRTDVTVTGLPTGHYVQEIRYNGVRLEESSVTWNTSSAGQNLEIVIDNRPATVSGTVRAGGDPAALAQVLLVQWPAAPDDLFRAVTQAASDNSGRFQFAVVPPGDYRILAIPREQQALLDQAGVLGRALSRAQPLSLGRSSVQNMTLDALDLAR